MEKSSTHEELFKGREVPPMKSRKSDLTIPQSQDSEDEDVRRPHQSRGRKRRLLAQGIGGLDDSKGEDVLGGGEEDQVERPMRTCRRLRRTHAIIKKQVQICMETLAELETYMEELKEANYGRRMHLLAGSSPILNEDDAREGDTLLEDEAQETGSQESNEDVDDDDLDGFVVHDSEELEYEE